jgi:hypothetical protein
MVQCPRCGYLIPETWSTCKQCGTPVASRAGAPDELAYATPARWSPSEEPVRITTAPSDDWWRKPSISLLATAAGFVLVLTAVFALPWMRISGGFFHMDLSYKQMQDLVSSMDLFSRVALDLGPMILVADLIVVGRSLALRGRIGGEAIAAPIGLGCLVLYVTAEIHGFAGNVNDAGASFFGVHAGTGSGPWVCLLGCACLVVGAVAGSRSTVPVPRAVASRAGGF